MIYELSLIERILTKGVDFLNDEKVRQSKKQCLIRTIVLE